jgi:flagellin-specific chaperone FliS
MNDVFDALVSMQMHNHDQELNEKRDQIENILRMWRKRRTKEGDYFNDRSDHESAQHANVVY